MILAFLETLPDSSSKKFKVVLFSNLLNKKKTIQFGAKGYEDFTIHKDPHRKNMYDSRHERKENWDNPFTAGFWSKWLLWNKSSINKSIDDIENRFNILIFNLTI